MIRKILAFTLISTGISAYADTDQYNDPTVNSFAASSQQFPSQNELTGEKGKKYNSSGTKATNNPTVNSFAASSQQFPQQNKLTGEKKQKYYTKDQMKAKKNNPTVNSRMSSANMFPEENSFNNNGKSKTKETASSAN